MGKFTEGVVQVVLHDGDMDCLWEITALTARHAVIMRESSPAAEISFTDIRDLVAFKLSRETTIGSSFCERTLSAIVLTLFGADDVQEALDRLAPGRATVEPMFVATYGVADEPALTALLAAFEAVAPRLSRPPMIDILRDPPAPMLGTVQTVSGASP